MRSEEKMKVTLIVCPVRQEGRAWYVPLGSAYVAAAIRDEHDVRVLELKAYPKTKEQIMEWLKTDDSDIYCLGGMVTEYKFIKWFASEVHKNGKKIIVGASIASSIPHLLLKDENIDILILGEGEETTKEVLYALENNQPIDSIKGAMVRGTMFISRPPLDINLIKMPAYDLFPTELYLSTMPDNDLGVPMPFTMIITARGCPYKCTFCQRHLPKTRFRSTKNIMQEIDYLVKNYKIKGIILNDELTITDRKRMFEICDELKARKLPWGCAGRVNLIDEELIAKMKEADCRWINVGIESANQRMLDLMNKRITVEQAANTINLCKKYKIRLNYSFIFGMPGENDESIRDTVEFHKKHDLYLGAFFCATPFPNTELWDMAVKMGKITPENEEGYIMKMDNLIKFNINFTDWSDDEFIKKKLWAETEIKRAYYKKHPLKYVKDNIHSLEISGKILKKNGLAKTSALALNKLKRLVRGGA